MDLQQYVNGIMAEVEVKRLQNAENLSLGELIAKLEAQPAEAQLYIALAPLDPETNGYAAHYPAFALWRPTGVNSYRGYYSDLAIGIRQDDPDSPAVETVGTLLGVLRAAVGQTFEGYKGGYYTMGRRTPVWVANYGDATGFMVVDVEHTRVGNEQVVVLRTKVEEW